MTDLPNCPTCGSQYTYQDNRVFICPECAHEWQESAVHDSVEAVKVYMDANGNVLNDGDTVTVLQNLKVKGTSLVIKVGTKVKNIRLINEDHDIDCKVDGVGAMKLKSCFVKKV